MHQCEFCDEFVHNGCAVPPFPEDGVLTCKKCRVSANAAYGPVHDPEPKQVTLDESRDLAASDSEDEKLPPLSGAFKNFSRSVKKRKTSVTQTPGSQAPESHLKTTESVGRKQMTSSSSSLKVRYSVILTQH